MAENQAYGKRLKTISKRKRKKERFLRSRMWFSTFISAFDNDRGTIPENIGNNIFIGNNLYTTRNSLNAVIIVKEMSTDTPVAFMSDLLYVVKNKVPNINIDFTFKNNRHYINTHADDLKGRVRTWQATLDNPEASDFNKQRAARLLYTVDVAKSGEKLYKSQFYITVRAKTGKELSAGVEHTLHYLNDIGAVYKVIKSDIKTHMDHMLLMSDKRSAKVKDMPTVMMSDQTIAESLPATQGINDSTGTFCGIDREMQGPYFINFRGSAKGKNIGIFALTGTGKTVLAQNWFMDMYADGYNMCIMDVKGTEFVGFTEACGGIVLSLKSNSTSYVNTFRFDPDEVRGDPYVYYDERFNMSKRIMSILADLPEDLAPRGDALIEECLNNLYLQLGVTRENLNTWRRTNNLDPYAVYDFFRGYLSPSVRAKYSDVADRMLTRLQIYMSRNGSNSHMFQTPFNYKDILETKVLTFNFGLIGAGTTHDTAMFKVRVLFMQMLNDEYVAYKYSKGEWTGKVLEEASIAEDYLLDLYSKDFKLRRAQNQVTIMLGNSVSALANNPHATGMLENMNVMVVGQLHKSSREYLVNEYGLEREAEKLEQLGVNPDYEHTFILVNRMQKNATTALLRAYVPERVVKGKLFKVVDTEDDD